MAESPGSETDAPPSWPADAIERRAVVDLIPYARNARKHTAAQVDGIAQLIQEFGWTNPVLIDDAERIIAGHGRVLAAQQLGIADIPVVVARGWTDMQKAAYTLADNQSALNATWNKELLRVELADLQTRGLDLTTIGFDAVDLAARQEDGAEIAQAIQLEPPRQYAVVMCANDDEWERLKVALDLTPVRRGGYKKGSPLDDIGTQRVVLAAALLERLQR
jgi:ParB-like chromosome segregation protein Spo0J